MHLGVNIDHVATVRQARRSHFPDLIEAARICENAGATSIVCHLREDRRHIQDEDVRRLRKTVATRLNLEMSIAKDIVSIALKVKPDSVTFVPEKRQELTTEGGLDVRRMVKSLKSLVCDFHEEGISVSLFVDPKPIQIKSAHETGVCVIELHTGRYAQAREQAARQARLKELREAARLAGSLGLEVAAGHGLDYHNAPPVVRIPEIVELNIGFSIISRALFVGLDEAVRDMRRIIAR